MSINLQIEEGISNILRDRRYINGHFKASKLNVFDFNNIIFS